MNSKNDELEELIEEFEEMEEWDERYEFLIELGRELPELPEEYRRKEFVVDGCMSQVWMATKLEPADSPEALLQIYADSDSILVKGLIAILQAAFSNRPVQEIVNFDVEALFGKLGLDQHLSPNRRNGLFAMVKRIRSVAEAAI